MPAPYPAVIPLDPALFRSRFAQFASPVAFADATLDVQYVLAGQYVSDSNYGSLRDAARELALQYMLAHLLGVGVIMAGGNYTSAVGIVTAATIDKVNVTLAAPPYGTDQWRWWLNTTPYGAALLALLDSQAVGGMYFPGGPPERTAFRKAYGCF